MKTKTKNKSKIGIREKKDNDTKIYVKNLQKDEKNHESTINWKCLLWKIKKEYKILRNLNLSIILGPLD